MLPVGLLYMFVKGYAKRRQSAKTRYFILPDAFLCLLFIFFSTFVQYNATYFATYKESGIRRISLAERLRQIPLSFLEKKIWPISQAL